MKVPSGESGIISVATCKDHTRLPILGYKLWAEVLKEHQQTISRVLLMQKGPLWPVHTARFFFTEPVGEMASAL